MRSADSMDATFRWATFGIRTGFVALLMVSALAPVASLAQSDLEVGLEWRAKGQMSRAYKVLRPLADAGDPNAMLVVGEMLLLGKGTARNEVEGRRLLSRAYENGNPEAGLVLGRYYVDQRRARSGLPFLISAADAGLIAAMELLGKVYRGGYGIDPSPGDSLRWYQRAIDTGSTDAEAAYAFGSALAEGTLGERDPAHGVAMLEVAAAAGHLRAQADLGRLYAGGHGIPTDYARAEYWLKHTAAAQYPLGELRLGDLYTNINAPGRAVECYGAALLDARLLGDQQIMQTAWSRLAPFAAAGAFGAQLQKPDGPCRFEPSELLAVITRDYLQGR
jgi:TPR repeat protein